jgi:hypothetical protein
MKLAVNFIRDPSICHTGNISPRPSASDDERIGNRFWLCAGNRNLIYVLLLLLLLARRRGFDERYTAILNIAYIHAEADRFADADFFADLRTTRLRAVAHKLVLCLINLLACGYK